MVLDRVNLGIRDLSKLLAALTKLNRQLTWTDGSGDAVEGRDFTILATSRRSASLTARIVRFDDRAGWRLENAVIDRPRRPCVKFRDATLAVAGPNAAQLTWQTETGPARLDLFALFSNACATSGSEPAARGTKSLRISTFPYRSPLTSRPRKPS